MTTRIRHLEVTFQPKNSPEFTVNPLAQAKIQPQIFIKFQVEKQVSSEPNNASLVFYNLSEEHAGAIDFKFDPFANNFGPRVTIRGGFLDESNNQMYSGVVVQALTTYEAPDYITRVECRNIYYELMRRPVSYQVAAGQLKADAILTIVKQAGGFIESGQETALRTNLNGAVYDEDELIEGTLDSILTAFSKGLPRRITVFWDDAGVSFDPLGLPTKGRETKVVSEETGLKGTPQATTSGLEYETTLDPTYRINDPIKLISKTTDRLALASGGASGVARSDITVASKIIHSGDNREGDFKTSVTTKFIDLIKQAVA
jgi:hypothetical protein